MLVADLGATSLDVTVADLSGVILAHRAEEADIALFTTERMAVWIDHGMPVATPDLAIK